MDQKKKAEGTKRKRDSTSDSNSKQKKAKTSTDGSKKKSFEKFEGMKKGESWKDFNIRLREERKQKMVEALESIPHTRQSKKEYFKRKEAAQKEKKLAQRETLAEREEEKPKPSVSLGEVVSQPPALSLPLPKAKMDQALALLKQQESKTVPKFQSVVPPKPLKVQTNEEMELERLREESILAYKEAKRRKAERNKRIQENGGGKQRKGGKGGKGKGKREKNSLEGMELNDLDFDLDFQFQ